MAGQGQEIEVDGQRVRVTNLDKVMYPDTGTTKGDVIGYYAAVAPWFVPHVAGRPATRKRWVHGTAEHAFFSKNADSGTPDWVVTRAIQHSRDTSHYPIIDDAATLVFLAQLAALEIHVPQWRWDADGVRQNPDRLVLDLDPGEGAGIEQCVELAHIIKEILDGMDLVSVPVTSGSKGIHLYAGLDGHLTSAEASELAKQLAVALEALHPDLVVSDMKKVLREGKVLLDWSQNNGSKTTVAPYSLRGRAQPWVAAPRTWAEIEPGLRQLDFHEVLERLQSDGDPLAVLLPDPDAVPDGESGVGSVGSTKDKSTDAPGRESVAVADEKLGGRSRKGGRASKDDPAAGASEGAPEGSTSESNPAGKPPASEPADAASAKLATYRAKRDAAKTPEPVPEPHEPQVGSPDAPTFVIQQHHARRLHHDFRLERDGVLVSWAVPKLTPLEPKKNQLAVLTEDHPLAYGTFEGDIPTGEYGAGHVFIWDHGTYETVKWRDGQEVIAILHGQPDGGLGGVPREYVLIHTGHGDEPKNWLIHLREDDTSAENADAATERPDADVVSLAGRRAKKSASASDRPAEESSSRNQRARSASGASADPSPPAASGRPTAPAASGKRWTIADLPVPDPMLASPGSEAALGRSEWHYEVKWDGYRGVAAVASGQVAIRSRNNIDLTAKYPELTELTERLGDHAAVLDGEIVALGPDGRSHFELLQNHGKAAAAAHYMVFDLLWLDGESLLERPYVERRAALEELLPGDGRHVHVPTTFGTDRELALATSRQLELEGLIAKRPNSTYAPGRRSATWLKLKNVKHQEVVIVGWSPGEGNRAGTIGSLLLAVPDAGGRLVYAGHAGSGFTEKGLKEAQRLLKPLERPDAPLDGVPRAHAKGAHWISPELVGEVSYTEWTASGHLRHPVWRGWRPDQAPADVRAERGADDDG